MNRAGANHDTRTHALIPADRCFWAILPAAALGGRGRAQIQRLIDTGDAAIEDTLQRWLAVPVTEVHAAYLVVGGAMGDPVVIACAVERSVLDAALAKGALTAAPAAIHASIIERHGTIRPADLNLLRGPYEPPAIRTIRRTFAVASGLGIALITGVLFWGMERRSDHDESLTALTRIAVKEILQRAAPEGDPASAEVRVAAEVRRLKAASAQASSRQPGMDAADLLAQLLGHWPRDASKSGLYLTTQSVQVGSNSVTITVFIPADASGEPLIEALRAVPGWTLQQSQRTVSSGAAADRGARLVLRLVPDRKDRKTTLAEDHVNLATTGGAP